jgi:predicted nucleotidyltransferase
MVDIEKIVDLSQKIVQAFHPERIILFGSYAYGTPAPDSDVDLLFILPFEGKSAYKSLEILNRVRPHFPVDILVRTPQQVRQRLTLNDFFLREILDKGRVLYEAPHA